MSLAHDEGQGGAEGVALFEIHRLWNGRACRADERARVVARRGSDGLQVSIEAPFHGDPAPALPPGRCPELWEYEVVELFLVGAQERYLEIEIGPHGHYLALQLDGVRRIVRDDAALTPMVERAGDLWRASVRIPDALLPAGLGKANAFAIHGQGAGRRYLAAHPTGGSAPDFHRLDAFGPLVFEEPKGEG